MTYVNTPGTSPGRQVLAVAAAIALTLLSACGDDDKAERADTAAQVEDAPADVTGEGVNSITAADASAPEVAGEPQSTPIPDVITDPSRKLVITMTVGIEVTEAAAAVDEVIALAARHGGQLYDSQLDLNDPQTASGDLVFKLPPEEVQPFLSGLDPAIGRRTGLDGTTSDVTTQIADLDAQILAAEASVDRVRVLLEGAKNLDDVIRLEIEFTSRQTHLEQLRAQQNTLDGLVALATITVHLTTAPPAPVADGIENVQRSIEAKGIGPAFEKGWDAFLTVLIALALFVGYTAPFLVLGGLGLLIAWRVGKRVTRKRPSIASPSAVERTDHPTAVG